MRPAIFFSGLALLIFSVLGIAGVVPYTQGLAVTPFAFSACHMSMQAFPQSGPSPLGTTITMNSLNCAVPIVYNLNFGDGSAPVSQVSNNVQWFVPHFYYCPSGQTTGSVSFTASGSNSDNNGNGGSNSVTVTVNCGTGTTTVTSSITTTSVTTTTSTSTCPTGIYSACCLGACTTSTTSSTTSSGGGGFVPSFWTGVWALSAGVSVLILALGIYLPSGKGHR